MALQQEIIQALGAKPAINANEEIRRSVDFLKAYLSAHPFLKTLVLGISGGQDSTLAGKLSQMAITELRDETGDTALQFIAVRLPYGVQADEQDCQDAIAFIQPDRVLTVNIKGKQLLAALGCPEHLYKKAPTADLEDDRPSLPDEAALGVTYDNIDDYLEGKTLDEGTAKIIEGWYLKTEHKRRPPITVFDDFWKK